MDPGQQSSSALKPFSDEETQLCFTIRDSMDESFRLVNALAMSGLWEEVSRRLGELGHHRSPEELVAKFGEYKPKRRGKKSKRTVPAANEREQEAQWSSSPPRHQQEQQPQERLARSRGVEAARKKLREEIDLDDFFSEEISWKDAVVSLRLLGRSNSEFAV